MTTNWLNAIDPFSIIRKSKCAQNAVGKGLPRDFLSPRKFSKMNIWSILKSNFVTRLYILCLFFLTLFLGQSLYVWLHFKFLSLFGQSLRKIMTFWNWTHKKNVSECRCLFAKLLSDLQKMQFNLFYALLIEEKKFPLCLSLRNSRKSLAPCSFILSGILSTKWSINWADSPLFGTTNFSTFPTSFRLDNFWKHWENSYFRRLFLLFHYLFFAYFPTTFGYFSTIYWLLSKCFSTVAWKLSELNTTPYWFLAI